MNKIVSTLTFASREEGEHRLELIQTKYLSPVKDAPNISLFRITVHKLSITAKKWRELKHLRRECVSQELAWETYNSYEERFFGGKSTKPR